jgi:hypothetical protein
MHLKEIYGVETRMLIGVVAAQLLLALAYVSSV